MVQAAIAHDLRTSLRAMRGFGDLLAMRYGGGLSPDARGLLDGIRSGASTMDRLLAGLQNLLRLEDAPLLREDVDLSVMASEILEGLRPAGGWTVEKGLHTRADAGLSHTLLEALLDNATKFSRGGPAPRVDVQRSGDAFMVQDNGVGFDMRLASKLFLPFQRLHGVDEFEGAGVGLAIVRRITARHGGAAWGEGRVGAGARFYFTLAEGPR